MRTEPDAIADEEPPTGDTPEEKAVAAPPQNKAILHAANKQSASADPLQRAPTPKPEN